MSRFTRLTGTAQTTFLAPQLAVWAMEWPTRLLGTQSNHNGLDNGSVRVLSGSDGTVLYHFNSDTSGKRFGSSVSCAGNVNGDGFYDFIVGAPNGGANAGGYARLCQPFLFCQKTT